MTLRAPHLLYAVLAVGALIWFVTRGGSGPEAEIRGRFDEIVELVEKEPDEGALEAAERARTLGKHFADSFALDVPGAGTIAERDALVRPFVGFRMPVDRLEVLVPTLEIEVAPSGQSARLVATVAVIGTGGPSGMRRGTYDVEAEWRRDGGDWRIAALQARETEGLLP